MAQILANTQDRDREDQLAALTHLVAATASDRHAAYAAQRAVDLATRRYEQRVRLYVEIVTAQTTNVAALCSNVDIAMRWQRASV